MVSIRSTIREYGGRRIASAAVVLVFLGFFVLTGGWRMLAFTVAGWFEGGLGLFGEFEPAHRIHTLAFSLLIWPAILGMLFQLRSPRENVAGQLVALVPWVALVLAMAVTGFWEPLPMIAIMGGLTLVATLLHPAGRELVTSISVPQVSRVMLALVLVAAVPLLAFAATQVGLQTGAIEQAGHGHAAAADHHEVHQEHVEHGHFATMAGFSFVLIGVGLLASLRQDGWLLPAALTGLLAVLFGAASMAFPEAASAADGAWAVAAIVWGVAFTGVAVAGQGPDELSPYGEPRTPTTSED